MMPLTIQDSFCGPADNGQITKFYLLSGRWFELEECKNGMLGVKTAIIGPQESDKLDCSECKHRLTCLMDSTAARTFEDK